MNALAALRNAERQRAENRELDEQVRRDSELDATHNESQHVSQSSASSSRADGRPSADAGAVLTFGEDTIRDELDIFRTRVTGPLSQHVVYVTTGVTGPFELADKIQQIFHRLHGKLETEDATEYLHAEAPPRITTVNCTQIQESHNVEFDVRETLRKGAIPKVPQRLRLDKTKLTVASYETAADLPCMKSARL